MSDTTATNSSEEYHQTNSDDPAGRALFAVRNIKVRRASVLVVDGVRPACRLLRLARQQVAHRCLIIYVRQRLSCVLLDLDRHGPAALEVCRTIRARADAADTIILLMTAQPSIATFDAALLAGADEILIKPLPTDELLARVEAALRPDRHSSAELRRRCEQLCKQRAGLDVSELC